MTSTRKINSENLLDRPLSARDLREQTEWVGAKRKTVESGSKSIIIFRIADEWLALPSKIIQEVTEKTPVHSLPHRRNNVISGLVNIRGQLTICFSLAAILQIENNESFINEKTATGKERLLVVSREHAAFMVSEAYGIQKYHPHELQEAPPTLSLDKSTYTEGLLAWNDKTIACLDAELLFKTLNRSF